MLDGGAEWLDNRFGNVFEWSFCLSHRSRPIHQPAGKPLFHGVSGKIEEKVVHGVGSHRQCDRSECNQRFHLKLRGQ